MIKIIALITTKDRVQLFERALQSVLNQTRRPDRLIVVTDSLPENRQEEGLLTAKCGAELIEDRYAHNYAGSLNSAVHYVLKDCILSGENFEDTYLAILDDDDVWLSGYLEGCERALNGEDFVVSGLIYCNEEGRKNLSIPGSLTVDSFLKGNPHIQGSNTFIRLSTLLRAGLFDENMSSTTDRDIFTRVMLLNPTYAVCNEYSVEVDAYNSRARITNGKQKKTEGLRKFYYKYNGYMSESVKGAFFGRAENLFGISRAEIEYIAPQNGHIPGRFSEESYGGKLTVGFIATEYAQGLRLLKQLVALKRENTKIVIFVNFVEDRAPYLKLLKGSGYRYEIIDRERVLADLAKGRFDNFVTGDKLRENVVKDIAVARTVLQKYLYDLTDNGDVVWVLDEDMELRELVAEGEGIVSAPLDIDRVIATYMGDYDAVVGNYSLDAPLPTLSTLRTSLLDFVYARTAEVGERTTLSEYTDYYYDLSDFGNAHLETPVKIKRPCTIDDIFSGKAQGRPLFIDSAEVKEVKSRGGNTLIFNRKLLEIPNWSLKIGDKIGRRSDYFWAWQAKRQGYKIANAPFATLHNRSGYPFDMKREEGKLLLDLIGSSFTKAVEAVGIEAETETFFTVYREKFSDRLVKYAASYYRINGLLSIVKDGKYLPLFSLDNLSPFLHDAQLYIQREAVISAFDSLQSKLHMRTEMSGVDSIRAKIEGNFSLPDGSLKLLGNGGEGAVLSDGAFVYKYFFRPLENIEFLKRTAKNFNLCEQLYPIDFFEIAGATVIRYPYEDSAPYDGGHAGEFAALLRFAKGNGFIYDNYKKDNFVVADGKLKLIDYGKSFLPYSEELHEKSVKRVFQMLRYPFLDEDEFKQLIQRSYQGDTVYIDDGYELLEAIVNRRYKEALHDGIIFDLVDAYSPQHILDYGAGKCKIANALSQKYKVAVFDIDTDTVNGRALPQVTVFERAEEIPAGKYDMVLNNLVLCCVENSEAEQIVRHVADLLKDGGHALISVCNPFFNGVQNTELRMSGLNGSYNRAQTFLKQTTVGGAPVRREYHRPIEYYLNLLERNGLILEQIVEGRGADLDTLLPIAEHIVFDCKKVRGPQVYADCSLLIKTNPMEHKSIYRNIRHIVTALERGGRFEKRVAVADLTETAERARRYDADDAVRLRSELERAKLNGLVDEIIYVGNPEKQAGVYGKYFGMESSSGHCVNGQGLYATLVGFETVSTRYVFQTDSDILYFNGDCKAFSEGLEAVKGGAVTATIGIAAEKSDIKVYGTRTEVRTGFIDLRALKGLLPLPNALEDGILQLPWHRALDKVLQPKESVRLKNKDAWFVHPENEKKREKNLVAYAGSRISSGKATRAQFGNVNLQGDKNAWAEQTDADVAVYIRGYNTPPEKLKRMFDSLKRQTYQDFKIVYLDDASANESAEYAKFILRYDKYFAGKTISFFNDTNVGELENFVFVMQSAIKNQDGVVINLDNDDYLVNDRAIEIIVKAFEGGAEITCGNCIRYDKPLKRYELKSFDRVWERGGDNIWLHPKCFKRYLFECIDIENDLKIDGKFVDVNTDFAIMLPMIRAAKRKAFIDEVLYYFEPSLENRTRHGKYSDGYKAQIKEKLLQKDREYYEKRAKADI